MLLNIYNRHEMLNKNKRLKKIVSTILGLFLIGYSYCAIAQDRAKQIIEKIICQGNERTKCDFITEKYFQKEGDILDQETLSEAKLRLSSLRQFKKINIP